MPRLIERTPAYRLHRATDRAVVTLDGKDFYLGRHGSKASRIEYDRLIAEWLANGRRLPAPASDLTIVELMAAYWKHAQAYYRKPDGTPTSEQNSIRLSLRPLKALYGTTQATEFGPLRLEAVRQKMIESGWVRTQINKHADRIRRMFKWAVAKQMLPPDAYHGLRAVDGLRQGRSDAVESEPVRPVPNEWVDAVLQHVSPQVRAIVELQLLTGMRPGEACSMRGCDLDTTGTLWTYKPATHKNQHRGHERTIYLGPRAQKLVAPFLKPNLTEYLFSPAESEAWRRQKQHEARKTPASQGNVVGSNRRRKPKWKPGECFDVGAYRKAIDRGCEAAFPPPGDLARRKVKGVKGRRWETVEEWHGRLGDRQAELRAWQETHHWHPHQLRHTAATQLRKDYGLEAAGVILGHKTLSVTELYAEKNVAAAQRIMGEVG